MTHRTPALLGLTLLIAACGGGISSYDGAMAAQLDVQEELNGILEGVTDEASAKAAVPAVKALGARMKEIADQRSKMPAPSMEEALEIQKRYASRMQEMQSATMNQMMKMARYPELANAVSSAMAGGR